MTNSVNFSRPLEQQDVMVENSIVSLSSLTGIPSRKGLEKAILSAGSLVNVVSDSYGHLPNQQFFKAVESKLEGIQYVTRSINRDNRSFAVDYILQDDNFVIQVKNSTDKIRPMLRFVNSYDGSNKTSGHFGFYREMCSNGLHVSHSNVGFSVKHRGDIAEIVLPEISLLIRKFMDNEFYTLRRKFEVMAETPIKNLNEWVKITSEHIKLFKFESSEKNPEPSLNARTVIETIRKESNLLGTAPNLWIGYNAFNELLHGKIKKSFGAQRNIDAQIFEALNTELIEVR